MSVRKALEFCRDEGGAIAPLYALALFGLIGMAGVGFDYARVMALDTELQNAADQAALAAASQLDGGTDSITRAQGAVRNFLAKSDGVYVNETRLSNIDDDADGNSRPITQIQFAFWEAYTNDAPVRPVALDIANSSKAEVVQVTVSQRALRYALTPIVGAIVGRAGATAMASVESAYCKVPPLMVCVPNKGFGAYDPATGVVSNKGQGARLHILPPGANEDMPSGLFGLLDFPYGDSNNNTQTLGLNVLNAGCTGETVDTQSGVIDTQDNALNTRLDYYVASAPNCDATTGSFCPSKNTTKNLVISSNLSGNTVAEIQASYASATCPTPNANNPGWIKHADIAPSDADLGLPAVPNPGYPRDTCHVTGAGGCTTTSTYGDGVWDIDRYMRTAHSNTVNQTTGAITYPATLSSTSTRYEVYKWENSDVANLPTSLKVGYTINKQGANYRGKLYCAYPKPVTGTGIAPPQSLKDRRVLSVAAVDCTGLKPSSAINILRYIDMFLVRPAEQGGDKEFYVEVIGEDTDGLTNTFQTFAKRKAVLIR